MRPWQYHPAQDLSLRLNERIVSLKREGGLGSALLHRPAWAVICWYMAGRHHLRIIGRENLPDKGSFVMIANHGSHLDALALGSVLAPAVRDHACPVAARDTFFTGAVSSTFSAFVLNALPISRAHCGMHALLALRERLQECEQVLILFPEGTRTRTGDMGRFRQGIGTLVAGTAIPVVPCWIQGAYAAWPPDRKAPGRGKISVTIGTPLCFPETSGDHRGWSEVAARLETAVRALAGA